MNLKSKHQFITEFAVDEKRNKQEIRKIIEQCKK